MKSCIVGYGSIGPIHANAVKMSELGEIEAICDVKKSRADQGAEQMGCRAIYSFDDALKDPRIDVIHVCTPHNLHVDMACQALDAGKHVVLEKPVAITQNELKKLIDAERKAKTKLCVTLQNRTNICVRKMQEIIKSDSSIGKLVGVSGFLVWNRDASYYNQDAWRGNWRTEGGSLLCNQAVHIIDLMHVFAGNAKRLRSSISTKAMDGIIETEDTADVLIEFENGVRGIFFGANTYVSSNPNVLELDFENVRFRYADQALYRIEKGVSATVVATDVAPQIGKNVWGNGHLSAIEQFYRHLIEGTENYLTLESALPSAQSILAMYESGKSGGRWVDIAK